MNTLHTRLSGVLVHPTSFPSPYGIGDLGQGAYDFIDFLKASGQSLWQVLPLGPTGFGDSPYQSFSAFAGQSLLISPDDLVDLELITKDDLYPIPEFDAAKVDYGAVLNYKNGLFKKAFQTFHHTPNKFLLEEFDDFCLENKKWLSDYAVFMACKDAHEGRSWQEWDDEMTTPTAKVRLAFETEYKEQIKYYKFIQFLFFREWMKLKKYANEADIEIIGDIPFFVSFDSADVWANKELYQLDTKGHPLQVAGVPPDYFSATGQLWGNPLYDWDYHKKTGYAWWIQRLAFATSIYDTVRIDHFRGFESYYSIPYGNPTAEIGEWRKGPNTALFKAAQAALGDLSIIAEDLGFITPEVQKMLDACGYPGMKVTQFAFSDGAKNTYLPQNYKTTNCVAYTGTHDNMTLNGWVYGASDKEISFAKRYLRVRDRKDLPESLLRITWGSIADLAIGQVQDFLQEPANARMNTPSTAFGNWQYRTTAKQFNHKLSKKIYQLNALYNRLPEEEDSAAETDTKEIEQED